MKLALVQYTSIEIEKKVEFITPFSDALKSAFTIKNYGDDLIEIIIGIICVSKNYEVFFIPKKPKYIKDKKNTKSIHTHQTYEVEKCLTYDIKLDFETFKNSSEIEAKKYLSEEILKSLEIIETMKSNIKDFDAETFKHDLENYFKERGFV